MSDNQSSHRRSGRSGRRHPGRPGRRQSRKLRYVARTAAGAAVLTCIRAWHKALGAKQYRSGFYGFSSSSAKAVATATDRTNLPGNLRYATWDKVNTTTTDWPFDPKLYTGHHRAHQYMVDSKETRGGHTITVDRSAWDAPVAIVG